MSQWKTPDPPPEPEPEPFMLAWTWHASWHGMGTSLERDPWPDITRGLQEACKFAACKCTYKCYKC